MSTKEKSGKKKSTFVRPSTNTTWCFKCSVCLKKHYKFGAHAKCYRMWCEICQDSFDSEKDMETHSIKYHKKFFCPECNQVFENIKNHKTYQH